MEGNGGNFIYTYEIEGDTFWYWFGDKGSDNFSRGIFSKDGNTITGRWQTILSLFSSSSTRGS
jgi:hypothetical protein